MKTEPDTYRKKFMLVSGLQTGADTIFLKGEGYEL